VDRVISTYRAAARGEVMDRPVPLGHVKAPHDKSETPTAPTAGH